jgi:hypothetical protein
MTDLVVDGAGVGAAGPTHVLASVVELSALLRSF